MRFLALIAMVGGLSLALLVLRVTHGQWDDLGLVVLFAAIANGLTGLFAYAILRRSTGSLGAPGLLLGLGYVAGIAGGAYFYFT